MVQPAFHYGRLFVLVWIKMEAKCSKAEKRLPGINTLKSGSRYVLLDD